MAAAEARAVWQRTANRCFVQEDAKRAPKLASKLVDAEPTNESDRLDHPVAGFVPLDRNPLYSNLPPDTRWWLQLHPTNGYQKGLTREQVNALEAEVEMLRVGIRNSTTKFSKDDIQKKVSTNVDDFSAGEKPGVKGVCDTKTEELESRDLGDSYDKPEMDSLGCSDLKKTNEFGFDPESPWIGSEKTDPWWRMTDRNDLASFVAQKSLDHIENCDLPPPQMHVRINPYGGLGGSIHDEIMASSSDWKVRNGDVSNKTSIEQGFRDSGRASGVQWTSAREHVNYESDQPFRTSYLRNSCIPTQKDSSETQLSESDPSKAELLEALRHSQTRAREAEMAAQQAYAEKEHIIKLFFRQASQLFAYKQWLQMLQLETLYLQIKNNDQPISSLFPVSFPWMPSRGKKMWKRSRQKGTKGKQGKRNRPRHDFGRYAVALALGLGLVSAGLLLGWTVGWMLPSSRFCKLQSTDHVSCLL